MKLNSIKIAALSLFMVSSATVFAGPKPPTRFVVNPAQSSLVWKAEKVTGKHNGTVQIGSGEILLDGGKVKQGNFAIDMKTIVVADVQDAGYNSKLTGHLKSDDFFGVEKFPTTNFVLTGVAAGSQAGSYTVKGNLTIKGITQPVEFPAAIVVEGKDLKATATIVLDRTKFGIRYGSKSFINDIGDKAIYDDFTLELKLAANAQ